MWAIVPIKLLDQAKQRLASVLSVDERRSLMLAMARDVLTTLSRSSALDGILIVSRTPEAEALAQAFGTERFAESPDAKLSEALKQAGNHVIYHLRAKGVFIVPADVPLITPSDIDQVLAEHDAVTIMPDSDNIGTNGLICTPPNCIDLIFDGKSFRPHVDAAFACGITPRVIPGTGFSLDIDTPSDLRELFQRSPNSQTGIYMEKSGIAERLGNPDNARFDSSNSEPTDV